MKMRNIPSDLEEALGALAFWVGYKHAIFHHSRVGESAIAAELQALLHGRMQAPTADGSFERLIVSAEYSRRALRGDPSGQKGRPPQVDLLVGRPIRSESGEDALEPVYAIEIKRSATDTDIRADFDKLAKDLATHPHARAFVVAVFQDHFPGDYVTEVGDGGDFKVKPDLLGESPTRYRARRATKALRSHDTTTGSWVILFELERESWT